MREAMATCEVGDDVYHEDPTINELERRGAALLGKEAAMSMANLIAMAVHCRRGEEVICGDQSHIFCWEAGGASTLLGVPLCPVATSDNGSLSLDRLTLAIRPDDDHCARTRLLALENTHNMCGGKVLTEAYLKEVGKWCKTHSLVQHMDGARLINAAIASKRTPGEVCQHADSVAMCLSKGMSAPVGSLLAGTDVFVREARRYRKLLGGGMRQAGVLAAAGLVAMDDCTEYMTADHAHAAQLAQGLAAAGYTVTPVETNIVVFEVPAAQPVPPAQISAHVRAFCESMAKHHVLVGGARQGKLQARAVLHRHITPAHVTQALEAFSAVRRLLTHVPK